MIRADIVYPNACSGTTIHCSSCGGSIRTGMHDDDDHAKRDSVFSMVVLPLLAVVAVVWTSMTTLR
jgi:hypothetical protein